MNAARRLSLAELVSAYLAAAPVAGLHQIIRCLGFPRFDLVEQLLPVRGDILDLGCGHGLMANLAAARSAERRVLGIDRLGSRLAAGRQVAARLGIDNVRFEDGRLEAPPAGPFDAIVLLDVLLYRPLPQQAEVIRACRARLRPGGRLLIKEQVRRPAWKARLVDWQERLVVGVKTGSAAGGGAWAEMAPAGTHLWEAEELGRLLASAGLVVIERPLHAWSYLSHHLIIGDRPAA